MKHLFVILLRAYQWTVRPLLHTLVPVRSGCRFEPTCSEYCVAAIRSEGVVAGIRKGLVRLGRCQPFSSRYPI